MKTDLKKVLSELYAPPANAVVTVDVPAMNFLMVDGQGDPNTSPHYAEALEALYGVSYAVKFAIKKGEQGIDYGVMPLEGLWWADDMADFATGERAAWKWTMMIMQPDFVSADVVDACVSLVREKKNPHALPLLRLESFAEGLSAQTLHVGPFTTEGATIQQVHDYIAASGHQRRGRHHEIYLSDIRKADPSKWKTVIRQPMR